MSLFTYLFSLLFPVHCIGCKRAGSAVCDRCARTLPLARVIDARTFAAYDYGHRIVKRAIWLCKYTRRSEALLALAGHAAPHIGEFIAEKLGTTPDTLVFVPIPQHKTKTRGKGFNQSALVAGHLARELSGTVEPALIKTVATAQQVEVKNKCLRLANVAHSMIATGPLDPTRTYIIVDDVITTGATMKEAERALRAAGARHILHVAIAHGYAR